MHVLLPIATYPDPTSKPGLDRALGLAARIGARVNVLVQEVDIPPIRNALGEAVLGVSQMSKKAEATSRAQATDIKVWIESRAPELDIVVAIQSLQCRPDAFGEDLMAPARRHDLTIMVLDAADPQRRADAEALIFGSGGPVVIVPATEERVTSAVKQAMEALHVAVAWDGSRAAARALRDAMPVLTLADKVSIITVGDDKAIATADIDEVRDYLEHHGVRAGHLARTRGTVPIGDTLQAVAVSSGADLLVMGAYGRSRLQEFILGGATRTILQAPRLPILLAH